MIELAQTLLPNLPKNLEWVYGIFYIIESIAFFGMLLSPFLMIFSLGRKKKILWFYLLVNFINFNNFIVKGVKHRKRQCPWQKIKKWFYFFNK